MCAIEGRTLMVGESPKTRQVIKNIEKISKGRFPVLILGETGTGKEVAARSIYETSPAGPFVTIDCSSLVGPLLESELFGHARGAFTGAVGSKLGLIEHAHGGTAFFDEIGELPLDLQAKLLRVLQEKEFRPVGSLSPRRSDFRIIAATNRDLAKEVERGAFRRDLYYRLNVVTIKLAPLRERREDIEPLANHFLGRYSTTGQHHFAADVLEIFQSYEWPGNVRELENCVQQMVAINTGPILHITDLPSPMRNFVQARRPLAMTAAAGADSVPSVAGAIVAPSPLPARIPPQRVDLAPIIPLLELEKQAILNALQYTNGDRGTAAHLLGIGRTTLYRKLKEYRMVI